MAEIFGNFTEQGDVREFLLISFSPNSIPIQQRWRNNGLSADFLADYWSTFFPTESTDSPISKKEEMRDAIGYIANELLENAMKFSYEAVQYPVSIGLYLDRAEMRFYVTNSINPQEVATFQTYIKRLIEGDTYQIYLEQLETHADSDYEGSHLGFLTMINDYGAEVAWKFELPVEATSFVTVTTMVKLSV